MYLSNQQRLSKYRTERRKEEIYSDEQQDRLYEQIAIERGLDVQSTALARLAKSVISKGADVLSAGAPAVRQSGVVNKSGFQILSDSIKAGKLDELVKSIIRIPTGILTKKQRIMQRDLINPDFKKMFNEVLSELIAVDSTPDVLAKATLTALGGEGNESEVEELIKETKYDDNVFVQNVKEKTSKKTKSISSEADTVATSATGETLSSKAFSNMELKDIMKDYKLKIEDLESIAKADPKIKYKKGGVVPKNNSLIPAIWRHLIKTGVLQVN